MSLCRTNEECFNAGWADGEDDEPMTQQEIERMLALHGRYLRPEEVAS
ncbi:MAG: hypothetical protein ACRDMV_03885 [Streptosporangiales bacterium]